MERTWWATSSYEWTLWWCSKGNQWDAGLYQQKHHQQRQKSHLSNLLNSGQATGGIMCSVLVSTIQKRCEQSGKRPKKGHRDDQGAEQIAGLSWDSSRGWERQVCLALSKEGLGETMFQYLKDDCKDKGNSVFTRSYMGKTRDNKCKLLVGTFQLDIRGTFFTMKTVRHWNYLPWEWLITPTLENFKTEF